MFSHILVPLDGSAFAEKALDYAVSLAQKYDGQLTLVQVLRTESADWSGEMRAEMPMAEEKVDQVGTGRAARYLREKEQELAAQGIRATALIMPNRGIPDAILEAAESEKVDVIVMTTHGLSGIQRWMMGSVARRIMRHATVPVLLIRNETK